MSLSVWNRCRHYIGFNGCYRRVDRDRLKAAGAIRSGVGRGIAVVIERV
jgi:hypothetical protein